MAENCVFCDRKQFEERLIAEWDGFYIIATLGQITDGGYVLLFPAEHTPCMGALTKEQNGVALRLTEQICHALTLEYGPKQTTKNAWPITIFEHGIIGQTIKHAHLHFLPAVLDLRRRIRSDFSIAEIDRLQSAARLQELYEENPDKENPEPYLFWTNPDGEANVCWDPPAPPQYLRIIAAQELGRPERANWRTMDPELDKKLWSETVRRLKPYFS